jgi:hypothetical protein
VDRFRLRDHIDAGEWSVGEPEARKVGSKYPKPVGGNDGGITHPVIRRDTKPMHQHNGYAGSSGPETDASAIDEHPV